MKTFDKMMQIILAAAMLLLGGIYGVAGLLSGLFIIGLWQIVSAIFTTAGFLITKGAVPAKLGYYWLFAALDITGVILSSALNNDSIFIVMMILACPIGIYYYLITLDFERRIRWSNTFIR
jgi:hypothetical protein